MTITIGIDPGLRGAIALLDSYGELIAVHDLAECVVDGELLATLVHDLENWEDDGSFGTVALELVHAMPTNGGITNFRQGATSATLKAVFALAGRRVETVTPGQWKRAMKVTADKETSRAAAIRMWPAHSGLFKRKKDADRAEAALIARYWWETHR